MSSSPDPVPATHPVRTPRAAYDDDTLRAMRRAQIRRRRRRAQRILTRW